MISNTDNTQAWYRVGAGFRLKEAEEEVLGSILPNLYGYHLVFLGEPELSALAQTTAIKHGILMHPRKAQVTSLSTVQGALESVPLLSDSIDIVVMSHTLETANKPTEILRETHRVLIPEGHVIITGFNPYSLWGGWVHYKQALGNINHEGAMLSLSRVKDWLQFLNFKIIEVKRFYYRPPLSNQSLHDKFHFLESGEKCAGHFGRVLIALSRLNVLSP